MSREPEEINNDFNSWDCFGASLMLGITPAILNFVFNDKDIVSTALLASVGIIVAGIVLLVSLITRWKLIGVLVNFFGWVLTIVYISIAVYMWCPSAEEVPPAEPEAQQAQEGAAS